VAGGAGAAGGPTGAPPCGGTQLIAGAYLRRGLDTPLRGYSTTGIVGRVKWSEGIQRRLGRLRPQHAPRPVLVWAIACWLMSLGLVAVLLIPGITDEVSVQGSGVIATFSAPLKFRMSMLVATAVLAGASVVWVFLRFRVEREPRRSDPLIFGLIIIPVALVPVLALLADHAWIRGAVAAVPALAFLVLAHTPLARRSLATVAGLGLVASLPWFSLAAYQSTSEGSSSDSWLWIGLFGAAAAFAAFGSYYGVARAAETRSARLKFLYRADLHPALVVGIVAACVVIVVLRLTLLREVFPSPDSELWSPFGRSVLSWAIALVVAALIAAIAVKASARPLTQFGERRVVAVLAGLGNLELLGSVVVITIGIVVAIFTAQVFLPTDFLVWVPLAKFVGVLILLIVVLLPPFRGTAARWIGITTSIFLAATTLNYTLVTAHVSLPASLIDFPATPVQVLLFLLVAAIALSIWNVVNPRRRVSPALVSRLAVVPLIAVHAGWLLPAAWSELGRIVLIAGVLLALFWLMPPVAADRTRHGFHVVSASVAQLVVLVVFVLAIPSLFADGALTVLGLLWLSVPIMAALTIDTRALAIDTTPPQIGTTTDSKQPPVTQ
jgi:hypothetical protein